MTTSTNLVQRVAFRADASPAIGVGHIVRCLTLANELRKRGMLVFFFCHDLLNTASPLIAKAGFPLGAPETLDNHAPWDWLVVDHYQLDARWEKSLRPWVKRIMAIDDLANRPHDCDLLLDQNLHTPGLNPYTDKVPAHCKVLLGPQFGLLREEFAQARKSLRHRGPKVERLLVSFGGTDASDMTTFALEALASMGRTDFMIDVIIGAGNPNRRRVEESCAKLPNAQLTVQAEDIAARMAEADIAIGATGSSTWERACLGLPSLTISTAFNQEAVAHNAAETGAIVHLGRKEELNRVDFAAAVQNLLDDSDKRKKMEKEALALTDALGAVRVAEAMTVASGSNG